MSKETAGASGPAKGKLCQFQLEQVTTGWVNLNSPTLLTMKLDRPANDVPRLCVAESNRLASRMSRGGMNSG